MGKGNKKTTTTNTTALDPSTQRYVDQMRQQAQGASNVALGGPMPGGSYGGANAVLSPQGNPMGPGMIPGGPPGGNSWFTGPQTQSVGQQAEQFMNPYMQNVIGGIRGEFDHLRGQASMGANQDATQGGAFGGSRHALMQGARLGALDRAQTQQVGGLLAGGYQNALTQGTAYAEQQRQLQQQQLQEPLWRQQQALGFTNMGMGPYGQTSTQTQTQPGGSWMGGLLGAGMTGLSLAGGLGWAPFAAKAVAG